MHRKEVVAMSRRTYTAIYERDRKVDAWNVRIGGLEGCQTHGRSLRQAQRRIREALAAWLDESESSLQVVDQLPSDLVAIAEQASQARRDAATAANAARAATLKAARRLEKTGISRRDAAALLGLSHQRVQQLVESAPSRARR